MKIQLGQITVHIDIDGPADLDVWDLKLRDIFKAGSISTNRDKRLSAESKERFTANRARTTENPKPAVADFSEEIKSLHRVSITDKTIVSIVKRLFKKATTQEALLRNFGKFEDEAAGFLTRPITEEIWAVYAAPIEIRNERPKICIVGLNKQNQFIILAIDEGTPAKVFQRVIQRGLDPKSITLGILSFHLEGMDAFKEAFKTVSVQLDWNEYMELSIGAETKLKLREAVNSTKIKKVAKLIDEIEAPRELLTYLDYPKDLQWAIRNTNPIKKLEQDLNSKLKMTEREHLQRVLNWAILRVQFQWLRMSVDSNQLASLKYMPGASVEIAD